MARIGRSRSLRVILADRLRAEGGYLKNAPLFSEGSPPCDPLRLALLRIKNLAASSEVFMVAGAGPAPDRRGARDGYNGKRHAASGGELTQRDY